MCECVYVCLCVCMRDRRRMEDQGRESAARRRDAEVRETNRTRKERAKLRGFHSRTIIRAWLNWNVTENNDWIVKCEAEPTERCWRDKYWSVAAMERHFKLPFCLYLFFSFVLFCDIFTSFSAKIANISFKELCSRSCSLSERWSWARRGGYTWGFADSHIYTAVLILPRVCRKWATLYPMPKANISSREINKRWKTEQTDLRPMKPSLSLFLLFSLSLCLFAFLSIYIYLTHFLCRLETLFVWSAYRTLHLSFYLSTHISFLVSLFLFPSINM